ncbi:hypothetical protein ACO0LC_29025, partial [Undibacterium sp. JH2W]|uniref:hypothetical protein n=1 Tax=Undibacterium sp. JH2W TaxID=3413037 RepID=UPI003BF2076E
APIQVSPLLPAIPGYIFFSVSLFLLIVYFNKQECPKKSGYLNLRIWRHPRGAWEWEAARSGGAQWNRN